MQNGKNDIEKVNLLLNIATEHIRNDIETYYLYSRAADSISRELNYLEGHAKSQLNIGTYYFRAGNFIAAIDSLNNAVEVFSAIGNNEGAIKSLTLIGVTHYQLGQNEKTLSRYNEALELCYKNKPKSKKNIATLYNNIGIIYAVEGNYPLALEYYKKSSLIKEKIGDEAGAADTYNNIGIIYRANNDHEKAIEYYDKVLEIRRRVGFERCVATTHNNIGLTYIDKGDIEKALYHLSNSLNIFVKLDDKQGIAHAYASFCEIYFKKDSIEIALTYLNKGMELAKETNLKSLQAVLLIHLAEIEIKKSNNNTALRHLTEAFNIANEISDTEAINNSAKLLSDVYNKLNDFENAYKYHVMHKELSDKIRNDANTKKIIGIEYEYKYQRNKAEQEILNATQTAKYHRQRLLTITFIICFILALALAATVIISLKRKQNDYKLISAQKHEIELKNRTLQKNKEEIQSRNQLLSRQAKLLSELNDMRLRFFANISHELRTPLTLILSPLTRRNRSLNSNEQEMMLRNATKLQNMIDDLLQLSRMEKGAVDMNFENTDINKILNGSVASFADIASNKGITIKTEVPDYECVLPLNVSGIEKIFSNLISNAIKFSPDNKSIAIKSWIEENTGIYCFTIADQGIGIPKHETGRVFNRFFRATNTGNIPGTGIGLSLVSDLITLHGGTIKAENSPKGGAIFTFAIPTKAEHKTPNNFYETAETKNTGTINYSKRFSSKTVLVVEDNNDLRSFLTSTLTDNYKVTEALNGKKALEILKEKNIDLIVSDIMMPEMDGYTMTQHIREDSALCHIPIILLTAKASEQSLIKGLELEADAYITKPFGVKHLVATINNLLHSREKLRSNFIASITTEQKELKINSMDEQFIINVSKAIENNIDNQEFGVENLCNYLHISRASMHRKITSYTGLSTSEFIRTIRIKRAAALLKARAANISEISDMVGFSDNSYFTKCFKKYYKATPSEYQNKTETNS